MYYSNKMRIGAGIAGGISVGIVAYWAITLPIEPLLVLELHEIFLFLLIPLIAILVMATALEFLEHGMKHFVKQSEEFRSKMNYCYSCGSSLQEATTADICPKCNSKLTLRDVLDVA